MISTLFLSKNQKLVKKWKKEHESIVVLAHDVIGCYTKNNHKDCHKALKKLNSLAVKHLMDEDIEFYRLLRDQKRLTRKSEELINDFTKSFKDTKMALMKFLSQYTRENVILDDDFFTTFNELVGVLGERIAFEEENLYSLLYSKG